MKALKNIFMSAALIAAVASCSPFDDSEFRERIDGYKTRIEALKEKAEKLNGELGALSQLTNGNVITSVTQNSDGRYVVTYKDDSDSEKSMVIATTNDLIDVPILGVKEEDGVFYWTITTKDGQTGWLLVDGQKVPVRGNTPVLAVDADGYWTVNGEKVKDSEGQPVKATDETSSIFKDASYENGKFTLVLGNGNVITLPVFNTLNLTLNTVTNVIIADPTTTYKVKYELTGKAKDEAIVAVAKTAGGVNAKIDRENREIDVTFGPDFSAESDGRMIVMAYDLDQNTIIKPVFFAGVKDSKVKISSAEQLIQFASDVNSGNSFEGMEVFLTDDIVVKDMAQWIPIGNGQFSGSEMSGAVFSGTFDGQGHSIDGISISGSSAANSVTGLFGNVQNGTVRNLTLGSASKIDVTSEGLSAIGGIAGALCGKAVVENCTNMASLKATVGVKDKRISLGGVVGATYAGSEDIQIRDCANRGTVTSLNSLSTNNGGNGVSTGGVVGFADANADEGKATYVLRCENLSDITAEATRLGGIIASLNRSVIVDGCVNRGNITGKDITASNSRVCGITAMVNNFSAIRNCKNYGDITYAVAGSNKGYAAGIAGQMQVANVSVTGCENYGAIRSDIIKESNNKYIAIICSNTNKTACTISDNKIGGKIGPYTEDDTYKVTDITPDNFSSYVFFHLAGTDPIAENNVFALNIPSVGINNAEDLMAFAAAVNSGAPLDAWKDSNGVINLLADIDMSSVKDWTPIGEASSKLASNKLSITSGNPFTGHFDGNGFSLKNFAMVCKASGTKDSNAWGLFGALCGGAVVENLVIDSSCSLSFEASQPTDAAVVAGLVFNSTLRNIENRAKVTLPASTATPDNNRVTLCGIAGLAFAGGGSTLIEKCVNRADITAGGCGNTKNGATGLHVAGIAGFSSNDIDTKDEVNIVECDNYGNISSAAARASGIVAAANRYTVIRKCTNYGNNTNNFATSGGSRPGNITCIAAAGSKLIECVNKGNLTSCTNGRVGGIISLVNAKDVVMDRVENYGQIVSDDTQYTGTIFGYCAQPAVFTSCIAQGDVGIYDGGSISLTGLNAANYFSHIGYYTSAATYVTPENIIWSASAASPEFNVAPSAVSLNVWGTSPAVAELSAMNEDWSVASDEWISVTDMNGKAVKEGSKSNDVINVKISASANSSTSVRSGNVVFTSKADASKTATVTVNQNPQGPAFPSKWLSGSAYSASMYESTWKEKHFFPSTNGSSATITAVRGEANASTALSYTIVGNKAAVSTLVEGDYWLFTMPNVNLAAGSAVEFGMTTGGDANQPKYFIVEYFDGTAWKADEATLLTAAEDASIKYSYMTSGDMGSSTYQNNTIAQVIRLESAVKGELKIRCRAVGKMTAGGGTQNISSNGVSMLPNFGFTAAYLSDLGVVSVKDVKNVLCLGNSFSYYSNPVFMLQEIAYSQGHLLRIQAHLKGGQTYAQHCALKLSQHAMNVGGYDFAFLQDQSQQPAQYGQSEGPAILKGCQDLTALVKAASPACKRVVEETWSYSGSTYGGFDSFENFDAMCEKGSKSMAQSTGAWVSPIGVAFKAARAEGISLYYTDNKHQGENGAYLKACVNYCVMFGEPFSGNVPDCGINPATAAKLRAIAEATVLGHEVDYLISR